MIFVTVFSYYPLAFLLLALAIYHAVRQNVRGANRAFNKLEAAMLSREQAQQLLQLR